MEHHSPIREGVRSALDGSLPQLSVRMQSKAASRSDGPIDFGQVLVETGPRVAAASGEKRL